MAIPYVAIIVIRFHPAVVSPKGQAFSTKQRGMI